MLTIVARPTVDPDRTDEAKAAMLDLVEATRREQGCIRYELYQDTNEPHRFVFVEEWESRQAWRAHMGGEAVAAFNRKAGSAIVEFGLQELIKVG